MIHKHLRLNSLTRVGILADFHIPFHSPKAIKRAIAEVKSFKPELLILNGDVGDFYSISRFVKDPAKRNLTREIKLLRSFLKDIRAQFPKTRIVYKFANHEKRLQTYLRTHAEELAGLDVLELPHVLKLDTLGIEWAQHDKTLLLNNNLLILHGDEMTNICTVYPAHKLLRNTLMNSIASHVHRVSHAYLRTAKGDIIQAWTTPCLCNLSPEYAPYNSWLNGYTLVELSGKQFNVENVVF